MFGVSQQINGVTQQENIGIKLMVRTDTTRPTLDNKRHKVCREGSKREEAISNRLECYGDVIIFADVIKSYEDWEI